MTSSTADGRDTSEIAGTVESVLADHPISLGMLFGSRARDEGHDHSDVDVAVVFADCKPGDPGHVERRLSLGADLALALGTDAVDVVDLRTAPPALVRAVFRDGKRLVGSEAHARRLRKTLLADAEEPRAPAERFDDALAAIDDHLA